VLEVLEKVIDLVHGHGRVFIAHLFVDRVVHRDVITQKGSLHQSRFHAGGGTDDFASFHGRKVPAHDIRVEIKTVNYVSGLAGPCVYYS
jgi:hypothetical protein